MFTTRLLTTGIAASLLVLAATGGTAAAGSATPDAALLEEYEPVLHFDPLEPFRPTRVESFITDSDLQLLAPAGTWTTVAEHPAPGHLPEAGTWRLNEDDCTPSAPLGGLDCYSAANAGGGGEPDEYGHVIREDGAVVLEYWLFYYDDVYSYTYPPSDFIWQAHEGDWESVDVVLDGDQQPLYAALSQHCNGGRRGWSGVDRFQGTHPIVHVAVGSHANYFDAGTHQINKDCIPKQALTILALNGLPLPVDHAFEGDVGGPSGSSAGRIPVLELGDHPAWIGFPGTWGEQQYFHAPPPVGTIPFGTSPAGPAFHPEWVDPLGTFAAWRPE